MSRSIRAALVAALLLSACQAPPPPAGAPSAPAQGSGLRLECAPRDELLAGLELIGEDLQDAGATAAGVLAETFANPDSGTWTWVLTRPDGMSCLLAWGVGWRAVVAFRGEEAAE